MLAPSPALLRQPERGARSATQWLVAMGATAGIALASLATIGSARAQSLDEL